MTHTPAKALRTFSAILATCGLAACGGGGTSTGGGGDMVTPPPMIVTPPPPTVTQDAINTTISRIGAANAVPIPPSPATGSASYKGGMIANATVNGVGGQKMFANIDASANLFNGTFSGTMRNFNMLDAANRPTEGVGGTLGFNGSSNGITKTVTATANGDLVGHFGGHTEEIVNMSVNLNGRVRGPNIFDNMDTLSGSVTGGSTHGAPLDIDLNGNFYLRDDL